MVRSGQNIVQTSVHAEFSRADSASAAANFAFAAATLSSCILLLIPSLLATANSLASPRAAVRFAAATRCLASRCSVQFAKAGATPTTTACTTHSTSTMCEGNGKGERGRTRHPTANKMQSFRASSNDPSHSGTPCARRYAARRSCCLRRAASSLHRSSEVCAEPCACVWWWEWWDLDVRAS